MEKQMQKTAIATPTAAAGAVTIYPQGNVFPAVRFAASSGTYNYVVRVALTPDETPSAGHTVSTGSASAAASTLVAVATSGGAPIHAHAIYIAFSSLSAGNMTVYVNTGESGP